MIKIEQDNIFHRDISIITFRRNYHTLFVKTFKELYSDRMHDLIYNAPIFPGKRKGKK